MAEQHAGTAQGAAMNTLATRCRRCGREIQRARTPAGTAVDLDPVPTGSGQYQLVAGVAQWLTPAGIGAATAAGQELYQAHSATCTERKR